MTYIQWCFEFDRKEKTRKPMIILKMLLMKVMSNLQMIVNMKNHRYMHNLTVWNEFLLIKIMKVEMWRVMNHSTEILMKTLKVILHWTWIQILTQNLKMPCTK